MNGPRACVAGAALLLLVWGLCGAAHAAPDSVFVVAEPSATARGWRGAQDLFWLAEQALAIALPAALLFSGLGARLRTALDGLTGERRLLTASLFAGAYALLALATKLPLSAARRWLAESYGLKTLDWPSWGLSQVQSAWPMVAAALLLGWAPYLLFARSPRRWPFWGAGILGVVAALLLTAQPLWHDLQPLRDPEVNATIDRLTAAAGASAVRVALREAERAEPCGSATVLGLGPSKVMVLDTGLLRNHPPREIAQTIAHELKHYTRQDDLKALWAALVLIGSAMIVLYVASSLFLHWSGGRFGFSELRDPASLPLLMLILALYGPLASAGFHAFGRGIELGADRFALHLTQDRHAVAGQMQRYLACSSLKDPDISWIRRTFRQSHPSLRERIALAQAHPIARSK